VHEGKQTCIVKEALRLFSMVNTFATYDIDIAKMQNGGKRRHNALDPIVIKANTAQGLKRAQKFVSIIALGGACIVSRVCCGPHSPLL